MKKTHLLFLLISLLTSINLVFGQAPNISYAVPLSYTVGTPITDISPANSGGAVPATTPYGQTTTFAGTGVDGFNNGASGVASFHGMNSIAMDKFQNIYIADFFNGAIRKIIPDGTVSTLANVSYPVSITTDNSGNVYAIKSYPSDIVKITPTGTVSVFSDHSNFSQPMDLAVDADGNVYVADAYLGILKISHLDNSINRLVTSISYPGGIVVDKNNDIYYSCLLTHLIMKVSMGTTPGTVSVFAGSGTAGFTNGNGAGASFNNPYGLSIDNNGNIYVADQGNFAIRVITPNGDVNTVSGTGVAGYADGSGTTATFNALGGVAYDGAGNIYVVDGKIRKVVVTGYTIRPALPDGLSIDAATGIIRGTPTAVLTAKSYTITAFNASGSSTAVLNTPPIIAYPGPQTYVTGMAIKNLSPVSTGGDVSQYTINQPLPAGLSLDPVTGVISGIPTGVQNPTIYTITASNSTCSSSATVSITTLIGGVPVIRYPNPLSYTVGIAISPVITPINSGGTVLPTPYGQTTTFAGSGNWGSTNGIGVAAAFSNLYSITMDKAQNIFVTDFYNNSVRKITPDGNVSMFSNYNLGNPISIGSDAAGNIYVSQANSGIIMKIPPAGGAGSVYANFQSPVQVQSLTSDAAGNLYVITNDGNLTKITTDGNKNLLSSSLGADFHGGIAVDKQNNIYYSCQGAHLIMKVSSGTVPGTTAGTISVFAGGGSSVSAGPIDGKGAVASFKNPLGISIDDFGNLYVADAGNYAIREITPTGVVTTVAGTGTSGYYDGLTGIKTTFIGPSAVVADGAGNVYVPDGTRVRKVATTGYAIRPALPDGLIMDAGTGIIRGTPTAALTAKSYTITAFNASGSSTAVLNTLPIISYPGPQTYVTGAAIKNLSPVSTGGDVSQYTIAQPLPPGLTLDPVTGVISGIPTGVQNPTTYTITASNSTCSSSATVSITTLVGGVPVISYANPLSYTVGIAISPVTTPVNSGGTVLSTASYGQTTTFAGTGINGFNNGPSGVASFSGMNAIAMDKSQNIYIADFFNSAIRKITPDGTVSTLANVSYPVSVATDNSGNVYAIKQYPSDIVKITPTGSVSVFSDHSNFSNPMDLAVDADGNVYVADVYAGISKIDALNNNITRLVTSISYPGGIVVDKNNDIYYSCLLNNSIMKVSSGTIPGTTAGTVSVFAGSGTAGFTNGNGAAASFNHPYGISIDNNGNIYVADQGNFAIRVIRPNGMVSTVSGTGVAGYADGSAAMATFNGPGGVAYDGAGNIYVIDGKIRKVGVTGYAISPALPAGLSMDAGTGIISGTPTTALTAKSYTITAFNASGSATATTTLEVNLPVINPPIITALSLTSAPASTPITVTGANFNSIAGNNVVFFGATQALVTSSTSTQLVVNVPLGATYEPISVLNKITSLTGYSKMSFLPTYVPSSPSPVINFDPVTSVNTFTAGACPDFLKIIDLDGDGLSDLLIANASDNTVSVFRNTSTNTTLGFAAKINFPVGGTPVAISVGDLDGDGRPDLVVVNRFSNTVSVFQNNTTNGGAITFLTNKDFATDNTPNSISIADIDGDGRPDIIIVNLMSNTISILQNTTQGNIISFKPVQRFVTGTAPGSINIADIDGDGLVDLVVTNFTAKTVSVLLNTSTRNSTNLTASAKTSTIGIISFANKVDVATGNQPSSVSIGDVDGDGKPDIIITNYGVGDNSVSVLHNSSVKGSTFFSAKVDFSTGNQPTSVQISDIDGDGKPDLVINNFNSKTISVLKNNYTSIGNISFTTKMDWATGNAPYSLSIGDMDGDGRPDVIVTNLLDNNIVVLHNSTQ